MAGALSVAQAPVLKPVPHWRKSMKAVVSVRASSEPSEAASSSSTTTREAPNSLDMSATFSPPPNFKPPEPKRFGVRPDKILDVLGASLALIFRLGTGVFVSGWVLVHWFRSSFLMVSLQSILAPLIGKRQNLHFVDAVAPFFSCKILRLSSMMKK